VGRLPSGVTALALAVAILVAAWVAAPATAQTLATLRVQGFAIAADRTSVRAGEPFHLTLTAHVAERIAQLDNVTLPDLTGIDVTGDERRCTPVPRGTACSETLTLSATLPGDRAIGPWTMDAVDARNHRPSRFSSNTIVIHVAGPSPLQGTGDTLRALAFAAACALGIVVLAGAGTWLSLRGRRRPLAAPVAPRVTASEPPAAPQPPPLHDLVAALAREPTRARAIAVRASLRARIGARDDETYADLVARRAIGDAGALAAFHAVEWATFCEEARVAEAAREAVTYLSR
jgi:hypothetical protein